MAGPLTCDDVWAMPDDGYRRELIDGMLVVNPTPRVSHQRVVTRLVQLLGPSCPEDLELLVAPVDWVVSDTTLLQPDIVVARPADYPPDELNLRKPPVLVVEVLSPSTARYDVGTKRLAYEAAGVPWYWVVDPQEPRLTVLQLVDGAYVEAADVRGHDAYAATAPFAVRVAPADLVRR
jgi:Uma2 family endonuclease